jgi:hypothetical protein
MRQRYRENISLFNIAGDVSACLAFAVWLIMLSSLAAAFGPGKPPAETRPERMRSFPTAEGFGAFARGGRGGMIIVVDNLLDFVPGVEPPIPGCFRSACAAKGPRAILFRTSGNIDLKAPLAITEPFCTIAGQSAPGDGVCVRNHTTIITQTHDIVVRYMRFRPGDEAGRQLRKKGESSHETDAISVHASRDVILDHCSASWANDEVSSVTRSDRVTVQWCFITESLNASFHNKGPHGYGTLVAYNSDSRITQHHNLFAFHASRTPRPGSGTDPDAPGLLYDFRNNLIFKGGRGYSVAGMDKIRMNYVGNFILDSLPFAATAGLRMYLSGNLHNGVDSGWSMIQGECQRSEGPFPVAPVHTDAARVAYRRILGEGGATRPRRDAVDRRVVAAVANRRGGLIDTQREVGGWPVLRTATPPPDEDADGMPDDRERRHDLPTATPNHRHDRDRDGYTDLEEYLNGTDPGGSDPQSGSSADVSPAIR